MKLWFFSIIVVLFCQYSYSQVTLPAGGVQMKFEKEHIDLGKVTKGEKVKFDYVFTNTGNEDILIDIVSGCECTTLDWPRKKIKPGDTARINVIFDSTEKEKSEVVDVDITLRNTDPKTGDQIFRILTYSFELVQ